MAFFVMLALAGGARAEENLESLTVDGVTYSNVTVIARTDTHISFKHSKGFASVKLSTLPPESQTQVGYTPPPPPKTAVERARDFTRDLTKDFNDPRLDPRFQMIEKEI